MIYTQYKPSALFPNQAIQGRDPKLYANKKPERPRRYHLKLKKSALHHLYPEIYPEWKAPDEVDEETGDAEKEPVTPETPVDPGTDDSGD